MLAMNGHNSRHRNTSRQRLTAHLSLQMRRYFLYSPARRPSSESLQQVCQSDQVFVAKKGSSSGKLDERIEPSGICTARQNRTQLAFGVVKVHPILTPVVAVFQQLKLSPEQRMERMGYPEMSLRTALMRCN